MQRREKMMRGFERPAKVLYALAVAVSLSIAAPASAEKITMTVVGAPPPMVTGVAVLKDFFIPEVDRRIEAAGLDFEIKWKQAYAGSLASFSEVFEAVEEGIADIGMQVRLFEESKLPLDQYQTVMPFGISDPAKALEVDARLRREVPEMNAVYKKYNQLFLASAAAPSLQVFSTSKIENLTDLEGLKIGASGAQGQFLRGSGATGVQANMQQSVTDINNGLYEGYLISIGLAFPFKTFEAAKFYTRIDLGSNIPPALTINLDTWERLPAKVQTIIREVAIEWGTKYVETDAAKAAKFAAIMGKKGVAFAELPQEERRKWAENMPNLAGEWVARMEEKGLGDAARKIVNIYMEEVEASGVPIIRDWRLGLQ